MSISRCLLLLLVIVGQLIKCNEDYYKTLGISRNASPQEVKKAYRKLSQKYHPDLNRAKDASDMFSKINNAYEILSDKEKRRRFDQYGEEGLKQSQEVHDPFDDMFDMFGQQQGQRRERRGPTLPVKVRVSLEDFYLGKDLDIKLTKQVICPHCRGNGADNYDDIHVCTRCNGKGQTIEKQYIGHGMYQQFQQQCPQCNGKGKMIDSTCHVCDGDKVIAGIDSVLVTLEKGVANGHTVTMSGAGDEFHDKASSDILFTFLEVPHKTFTRNNNDLAVKVQLSLEEALVGFSKEVRHLDGRQVKVERSRVTQPGDVQQLRGEGMPIHNGSGERGHLFITYQVIFKEQLDQNQKSMFRQFFQVA